MARSCAPLAWGLIASYLATRVTGYRVPIADTDALREVCSGMWGGKEAYVEVSFNPSSAGQVALVVYEWQDVPYLGVETPDNSVGGIDRPKTYICTTSAARTGLCTEGQLGAFITSPPDGKPLNSTTIFTSALKFTAGENPLDDDEDEAEENRTTTSLGQSEPTPAVTDPSGNDADAPAPTSVGWGDEEGGEDDRITPPIGGDEPQEDDRVTPAIGDDFGFTRTKRVLLRRQDLGGGMIGSISGGLGSPGGQDEGHGGDDFEYIPPSTAVDAPESSGGDEEGVVTYSSPIIYAVKKTGYYCIGIVPVTLVNSRSELSARQAMHAEYSGMVLFHNTFEGELPAAEYPKINFYLLLSVIYFALGCGWAFLCFKHRDELLPMQYYISGTIIFLIIEMLANFAYYRYINKHGGGATSLAFLFVVAILNAARNSLSFFLLLIVSMGLSVVRQSLGTVMTRVRILTGLHFLFGVLYSVGTVQVELDSAALVMVMLLIFPLALTLTAFLMWIIISLNGTIMHLQAQKQRTKLQMFQRLWRILILAVIAIAGFFVVSSMSLSNRLDEDYAPNNWRYRWVLLDGSLASIYLVVFSAIAWIWRPTRDNVRFAMSQELAQDEDEADAEDYEIDNLENGRRHRPLANEDDEDEDDNKYSRGGPRGDLRDENVVFAMGDDSDDEDEGKSRPAKKGEYKDDDGDESDGSDQGLNRRNGKDD